MAAKLKNKAKLKFSINTSLMDKISPANKISFATGFESTEMTIKELSEVVQMGFAISYQFIDGIRNTANFLATDIVEVDVDNGRTLSEVKKDPLVRKYCEFLYTTPSHSLDHHRYRLVFSLPRTITSSKEIRAIAISLTRRLGGDMAATDPARIFYGSTNAQLIFFNKQITVEFLDELLRDGVTQPAPDSIAARNKLSSSRSSLKLAPKLLFKRSDGSNIELCKADHKYSVYCPFHLDDRPSAFISPSAKGGKFFHCSACKLTRWMADGKANSYDFDDFTNYLKTYKEKSTKARRTAVLDKFLPADFSTASTAIQFRREEFLQLDSIPKGLTFIKSPKGSGKTSYLAKALEKVLFTFGSNTLEALEEGDITESPAPIFTGTRALLIGHRQALIRDLSNRLGLNCYLDDTKSIGEGKAMKARYGVCLDSLWRVRDERYDILVIDEVEQVLSHFLSETVGEERWKIFTYFKSLLINTPRVVVLDADLGWTAFTTLTQIKNSIPTKQPAATPKAKTKIEIKTPISIFINEWIPAERNLNIYSSQNHLMAHLVEKAFSGKRIFVTSNSKEKIKAIRQALDEKASATGIKRLKMFEITSENSRDPETQRFIKNIKSEILKYDAVLSSPSLGTGVDITFDEAESKIDVVYGFFENLINNHMEIDQQLGRVRHPGEVHAWISPRSFSFETEFEVIRDDFLKENLDASIYSNLDAVDSTTSSPDQSLFVNMASLVLATNRASKNNLKLNFIEYKNKSGWKVHEIPLDEFEADQGRNIFSIGKAKLKSEAVNRIMSAPPLVKNAYEDIKDRLDRNDGEISRIELESYWRTKIELFYQAPATVQLVEKDNKGRFRDSVYRYLAITNLDGLREQIKERFAGGTPFSDLKKRSRVLRERALGDILLYEILSETPIFINGQFQLDAEIQSPDLKNFVRAVLKYKIYIETQLDKSIRTDVKIKSIEQLGEFLKIIGLKLLKSRSKVIAGKKIYFYVLDTPPYVEMESLAVIRRRLLDATAVASEWDFVNKLHGFDKINLTENTPPYLRGRRSRVDNGPIFNDFI